MPSIAILIILFTYGLDGGITAAAPGFINSSFAHARAIGLAVNSQ